MSIPVKRMPAYKIVATPAGDVCQFFCDLSGALVCTSKPLNSPQPEQELKFVWERECKPYFNHCQRCGKWVMDAMYNADVLECVACSPWEETPAYCSQCGAKVTAELTRCPQCHARLQYGREDRDGSTPQD